MKEVFKIFFFTFSNTDIWFVVKKLVSRSYITIKVFFITKTVEFINRKEFVTVALDKGNKTFVIYMATLIIFNKRFEISIYLF